MPPLAPMTLACCRSHVLEIDVVEGRRVARGVQRPAAREHPVDPYCGKVRALTDEHVLPRSIGGNLIGTPTASGLSSVNPFKVGVCCRCNSLCGTWTQALDHGSSGVPPASCSGKTRSRHLRTALSQPCRRGLCGQLEAQGPTISRMRGSALPQETIFRNVLGNDSSVDC